MAAPQSGTHRMPPHLGLPCAPLSDEDIAKSGVSSPVPSPFFSSLAAVWADSRKTAATR